MQHFLASAAIAFSAFAGAVQARDFYIIGGNTQNCPCSGGLSCPCTNSKIAGIVPVDEFECGPLQDTYIQLGAAPASCNTPPDVPIENPALITASGCVFGEAGTAQFSLDAGGEFWNIHLPDSDFPELIRATCVAPDTCEVGDADSGVVFDSKVCSAGIGSTSVVDALYVR